MAAVTLKSSPPMGPLMLKAALGATPIGAGGRGKEVPDKELLLPGRQIDVRHVADYCRVCGFTLRDSLPATYPHMLAFPLQMALMTDPKFPFPPIGSVHLENKIVQHRPIHVSETIDLRVTATKLVPHAKGRAFTMISEAHVGDELVWEDASLYLRRGGGGGEASSNGASGEQAAAAAATVVEDGADGGGAPEPQGIVEWRLPGGLGREYGAVSGDRNPIHMHNLTAKLFGFPRAIAHGMWTKARCLAAFDGRLPDAFAVEVAFKRPILLPAKVLYAENATAERTEFTVTDARKGTPHLAGVLVPV